jgi:hypothetical protein
LPTGVLVPLIISVAIVVPLMVLLWRVLVVGGELRREAAHGRAAMDIAHRADTSLAELAELIDALRRGKAAPQACAASLAASADALRRYAHEAESVDKQAVVKDGAPTLASEIERARRAVELIEHGRLLMLETEEDRRAEGETSVKRGYLNLLHARDALKTRASAINEEASRPDEAAPKGRGWRQR